MRDRVQAGFWMFVTALRTEQLGMRGNPLLLVNAGFLPVVFLIISVELSRPDAAHASRLIFSVMLTALWGSVVWISGGVLRRERTYGTLARCVSGVHSPYLILLGKSLGATVYSIAAIVVSTTVTALALRLPVALAHPLWVLVALLVLVASATALGALLSCLFLITRNGLIWSGALMYPVFMLGGLLIPPSALPEWLRWVPMLLSLRWLNEFMAGAASGDVRLAPLGIAVALTVAYALAAGWAYLRSVTAARRGGTLDFA